MFSNPVWMKQVLIDYQLNHTVNCSIFSGQKNRRPGLQIQFSGSNIEKVYAKLIATVFAADDSESSRRDISAGCLLRLCTSSERSCTGSSPWSATSEDEPVSEWWARICRSQPPRGPTNSGDVGACQCCTGKRHGGYCCSNRCELLPKHRRRTSRNHSQWICGCVEEPYVVFGWAADTVDVLVEI